MTKKTFTFFLAFSFFSAALLGQQVEETQRVVVTKRTATWCPNCGNWGWTLMEGILEDNADKAIIIAAHEQGSSLSNPTAEEITSNWGTLAQPAFFVNEVNQNVSPSNVADKRASIKQQVDDAFASSPVANVGFDPVYQNGEIKVDAKVKFFQEASGDFYLGIYLLEDNVQAQQSGSVSDNIHDRVLQYSFTDGSWGEPLVNGNVVAGTEFTQSFALPIGSPQGYAYHVVGIIFNLDGGIYKPVNAWSTTQIDIASFLEKRSSLTAFEVSPTVADNTSVIEIELPENQQNASLVVIDGSGRSVATLFEGQLPAGSHSFTLHREKLGSNGVYFLRFSDGKGVSARRVIFQ